MPQARYIIKYLANLNHILISIRKLQFKSIYDWSALKSKGTLKLQARHIQTMNNIIEHSISKGKQATFKQGYPAKRDKQATVNIVCESSAVLGDVPHPFTHSTAITA